MQNNIISPQQAGKWKSGKTRTSPLTSSIGDMDAAPLWRGSLSAPSAGKEHFLGISGLRFSHFKHLFVIHQRRSDATIHDLRVKSVGEEDTNASHDDFTKIYDSFVAPSGDSRTGGAL
jgi:hypothetical protein